MDAHGGDQCEVQPAAGSRFASAVVLLRDGPGATWATARGVAETLAPLFTGADPIWRARDVFLLTTRA